MHVIIRQHEDELTALCRRFQVLHLDAFGSAVSGRFDPSRSDLDFLVEFQPMSPEAYADAWFGLLQGLESLFTRQVDLVTVRSMKNPYFAQSVNATKETLFAADAA